jgi:hypothetical protein
MLNTDEEIAFNIARSNIDRSAWKRWVKSQQVDTSDTVAIKAAFQRWLQLPLLHAPILRKIALQALGEARGRRTDGTEPFPATLWLGGAEDTWNGRAFLGTISGFVKLLHDRSGALAPKREGWVIEPTTNPEGRRTNEKTLAMHALFLDCDGTGNWDRLLATLEQLDYCFVAYQSGGWTPTTPKWRVVIPLHAPHDTRTPAGQDAWRAIYNHARVVFGACAELLNVGFDPATETPCCPWFLTEKRDANDPPRQVTWRIGHTLDLTALSIVLPEVPEEQRDVTAISTATQLVLDDERLNVIINKLAAATNSVPTGRRDLYLALPGALLDRGVPPDDVMAIVEAVSASYPRPHADKHADNLHSARTTIGKWEAKTPYTRIGTLNEVAPHVATALDSVLPDLVAKGIADSIEMQLAPMPPPIPNAIAPTQPQSVTSTSSRRRRGRLTAIGRTVSPIVARLKASPKNKLAGVLVGCFSTDNCFLILQQCRRTHWSVLL